LSSSAAVALAILVGTIDPAVITLFSTIRAFVTSRSLASRIYRRYALLMGLLCAFLFFNVVPNLVPGPFITVYNALGPIVLVAWLDATIPIARRSDPRLSDPLGWGKVRIFVWPAVLLTQILTAYFSLTGTTSAVSIFVFLAGLVVLAPPALTVFVEAKRSRDPVFRRSLIWLSLFILAEFAQIFLFITVSGSAFDLSNSDLSFWLNYSSSSWPSAAAVVVAFYFLYRATGSLVYVNKLSVTSG